MEKLYIRIRFLRLIKVLYVHVGILAILQNTVNLQQKIAHALLVLGIQREKSHQTVKYNKIIYIIFKQYKIKKCDKWQRHRFARSPRISHKSNFRRVAKEKCACAIKIGREN